MNWDLKKTTASLITSLLAFTTVHAKEMTPSNKGTLNPPVQPYTSEGLGIFVNADLLLWKPHETGLDYVTKNYVQPLPTFTVPNGGGEIIPGIGELYTGQFVTNINGSVKNPEFNWNYGFQFGFGWNPSTDGWDVLLEWTHLHATASDKTEIDPATNDVLIPAFQSFLLSNDIVNYSSADSHWKLDFNTLDLEVGRQFLVSKRLSLRPFAGLRAAWIHQRYDINSQGYDEEFLSVSQVTIVNGPIVGPIFSQTEMKSYFNGLGPRIGLNTNWALGAGFSIYGDMAFSLMLGHFKSNYKAFSDVFPFTVDTSFTPPVLDPTTNSELTNVSFLENSFKATKAATDLGLGIRYLHKFYDDFYCLSMQLGWDHRYFFDQNQFISFQDVESVNALFNTGSPSTQPSSSVITDNLHAQTTRGGDLSLQGFNFSIRLDF